MSSVVVIVTGLVLVGPATVSAKPLPRADKGRPGFTFYDGVPVSFFEYGPSAEEAPTIVLSSGLPGSSMFFADRARDFAARDLHVVRYDQRGSGASGHPENSDAYSLTALAEEFGAVVDATAAGDPVNVFGSGFSVFVASEYAALSPGRISSITSLGAPSVDLAFDSLARKTAEADAGQDLGLKAQVAAQWAALSYLFTNADTAVSHSVADALAPVHAVSNTLYALAADDDLEALRRNGPAEYPLFATQDTKWGTYKYQWVVRHRMQPVRTYLDVPELRVYQPEGDPIETPILLDGLGERTPDLRLFTVPGTRLSAADDSPTAQLLVDGALDAIRDTPQ